ncbi:MAG: YegS/Rv2252/BmrU family lipid kinase [Anaerolineales bacterium]|jgi:diacylglycerol kinase (ATP)
MKENIAWMVYNPAAGRFPAAPLLGRAAEVLRRAGWHVHLKIIDTPWPVADVAQEAVEAQARAVFVVGGDGSVGQVASVLVGTETALGVLPAGTANVWAQELELPRLDWMHWFALEQAAESLARGEERLVDLGVCNENLFLLWSGVGLDGHIVNSIEPRERWEKAFGIIHYATLALWKATGWRGIDITARSGDRTWEGRFLIAVASNIPAYAGGLVDLAPGAKVDDGLLDFWLIRGKHLVDALPIVAQIFTGDRSDIAGVVNFRAAEATFEMHAPAEIQCDGEPCQSQRTVSFGVIPQALRVLVPADRGKRAFSSDPSHQE